MDRMNDSLQDTIRQDVTGALAEDVGSGDLTAMLVRESAAARARIIAREDCVLAGRPWVDEIFRQLSGAVDIRWHYDDGAAIDAETVICDLSGPARALLTGERTALNFLQTLSATATVTSSYVATVAHTAAVILDTRKTIPGLRTAQKYAVRQGGGQNHRHGLYDAILIKENHIASAGSLTGAVNAARKVDDTVLLEVEVESFEQLREALACGVRRILVDNFSNSDLREAVEINRREGKPPAELEASGGLTMKELAATAETGVDFISVGALTKNVRAVDLSMRFLAGD